MDDPAQLHVPPNIEGPPIFAVGILEEWNPTTFVGSVRYRGALLRNLAVINRVEALSFTVGQQVSLLGRTGTGVFTSFAILGSFLTPGTTAAEEAIAFLQSDLAHQISSEIFADRIHSAKVLTQQATTSTSFTDLATVGPEIEDVPIEIGVAIVSVGAKIYIDLGSAPDQMAGYMGCAVSGATSVVASVDDSVYKEFGSQSGSTGSWASGIRASYIYPITGLNPGLHTFTAKYRVAAADDTSVNFSDRQMVVIAF
jgi:hypothetical protein